jgi:peptidylprolyl isomerase
VTDRCFLDLAVNGTAAGRVIVGLFGNACPKTVANFKALCIGVDASAPAAPSLASLASLSPGAPGTATARRLHLKGSQFHKIVPV